MNRFAVAAGCLVLLGGGLFFAWRVSQPKPAVLVPEPTMVVEPTVLTVTPEVAARAAKEIPLAVAHLENHETQAAITLLTKLEQDFPQEKAVLQNLVIGRYLAYSNAKETENKDALKADALIAVEALLKARPDDWHSQMLSGLVREKFDDLEGAYAAYEAIAPISTSSNGGDSRPRTRIGDVTALYAMAKAGLSLAKGPERPDALAALVLAAEKDPENFWILRDLILVQAEEKDSRLAPTLDRLSKISPAVESSIRRANPRFSFSDELEKAQTLLQELALNPTQAEANWKSISMLTRRLCNSFYAEDAAQSDQKYLYRHPLDFVVHDLPASVAVVVKPEAGRSESTASLTLEWGNTELPAALKSQSAIRQVRLADMTLDRQPELCVLAEANFSVWSRGTDAQWTLLMECPVTGASGFLLTDLDDDSVDIAVENDPSGVKQVGRADLDVVLFGPTGVQLVQNKKTGKKHELLPWPEENSAALSGNVRTAETLDADLDGDMDLILAGDFGVRLGFNTGKPLFFTRPDTPVQVPAGIEVSRTVACDLDRDQDVDVLLLAGGRVFLLENLRHATLRWKSLDALEGVHDATDVRVLDVDGNASWDLLLTGPSGGRLALSQTPETGKWLLSADQVRSIESKLAATGSCQVADLDNDGAEDVLGYGDQSPLVLMMKRGQQPQGFEATAWASPAPQTAVKDLHPVDFDRDGDLDVCLVDATGVQLLENKTGNQNAWLTLEVVGKQVKSAQAVSSGRVNHYGVGSLLEVRGTSGYQARFVTNDPPHLGLGPQGTADLARLIWPNGFPANVLHPKSNQILWEVQTLLGSCPYLYTWDGSCYRFATDLLWAAPLGMPSPAGGLTPCREWEYLKVPGSLLKEQHGLYSLQLTEELYEAAYFDHVELIAVDHPTDVEVYSNEKVGPPSIAEKKIHTVRSPRTPLSAIDQQGRDVLPALSNLDEVYTRHWDHKIKQGWTEKTTLELDLGVIPENAPVTLFLTGWVYPTDPSVSVSIQQDAEQAGDGIQPPSLEVPDGQGGWKIASPYIGFPGGKTKTMAIDLTGQLAPQDGRLRIVTSMELCWDQAFFTVDELPAEVRETPLELVSADLHFRGCSARIVHPQFGPERYDYSRVDPMVYNSMGGKFTRYGDVKELLLAADDRQLVLGCGDECTLTFNAPAPPPKGWTRDFLIHNVGWDKDCNPQNVYCKTVEPLPYQGMASYPPSEPFPDDEVHRDYLRTYQTREQSDIHFRRFLFLSKQR